MCGQAFAARTVSGTVLSSSAAKVLIRLENGDVVTAKAAPGATVTRGQLGKSPKKAKLSEFATGDRVVAVVDSKDTANSLKAFYAIAKGTIATVGKNKVTFKDGRSLKLHSGAPVVYSDGVVGEVKDLKPGLQLVCRVNPSTGEAWTVVANKPASTPKSVPKPAEVAVEPVKPALPEVKPVIESVSFKGPDSPKAKDWIRVDLKGTPGGRAICEVKGLIPRTVMNEVSPGEYRASIMVPGGKIVHNEPLIGHLTIAGVDAPVVQAGKLFSVDAALVAAAPPPVEANPPTPPPAPEPVVVSEIAPVPVPEIPAPAPEPAPVPAVEPPKAKAPVVLASPTPGAHIQSTLTVTGTAEPSSNIMIEVSYANGLEGLMKLAGSVSSQLIAADASGAFKFGPVALEGPLATNGLVFTVKAYYPEIPDQSAVSVSAIGDRN